MDLQKQSCMYIQFFKCILTCGWSTDFVARLFYHCTNVKQNNEITCMLFHKLQNWMHV